MDLSVKSIKDDVAGVMSHTLRQLGQVRCATTNVVRSFDHVVIVAPLGRNNGISRGARYQHKALLDAGIDASLVDASPSLRNPFFRVDHRPGSLYVIHCGGPQTSNFLWSVMPHAARAYRVAYWAWELPDPAPGWKGYDALVHEIWTPSAFSRDSLAKASSKPIHVVPHFIAAQPARRTTDPGVFKILAMADSRSSFSRKNPAGAIRAFRAAFGTSAACHLTVKLSGSAEDVASFVAEMDLAGSPNISVIDTRLSDDDMTRLFQSVDLLLSLHRSEGFGLPMMEAMACGTPVMATGWSGNADFLHAGNGFPIGYTLVPVNDQSAIYANSQWADPDVERAAAILKELGRDRDRVEAMSRASYQAVKDMRVAFPL